MLRHITAGLFSFWGLVLGTLLLGCPFDMKIHHIQRKATLGFHGIGWITAVVGVMGMCVNCQDCEAVGKLFADLWEKACLFPSGCERLFHRHERQFSIFP